MKKTLSLILAVVMIFAALGCTAFADSTKTDALMAKVKSATEMTVSLKSGDTALGSSTDTFYLKGDSAAYDYNTGFFNVRVVLTGGDAYAYLPALPFFYVKVNGTAIAGVDVSKLIQEAMGITDGVIVFEKSYEETIDGTTYYVEQYNDRAQAVLKFCYVGDELKLLIVTNKTGTVLESTQYTYFNGYSFTCSEDAVKAPTGFDLTPLLKTLFVALLASAA